MQSDKLTSAPCCSSNCMQVLWPSDAANSNAVLPSNDCQLTSTASTACIYTVTIVAANFENAINNLK